MIHTFKDTWLEYSFQKFIKKLTIKIYNLFYE